eukprot:scaffold68901_cov30-Tisochrysis_lutea.AAC.2
MDAPRKWTHANTNADVAPSRSLRAFAWTASPPGRPPAPPQTMGEVCSTKRDRFASCQILEPSRRSPDLTRCIVPLDSLAEVT